MQKCVKALNHFYAEHSEMWQVDGGWDGFQWLVPNDSDNSIVAFTRSNREGKTVISLTNFTPQFLPEYRLPLPVGGKIREILNTDREEFGGSNQYNAYELTAEEGSYNGMPYSALICVPPLSSVYFEYEKQEAAPKRIGARTSTSEQLEYIQRLKADEGEDKAVSFASDKNSPKLKLKKENGGEAPKPLAEVSPFSPVVTKRASEMKRHRTAKSDSSEQGSVKPSGSSGKRRGITGASVKPER
jgi:1,4-alpha-glucan branching enzyme